MRNFRTIRGLKVLLPAFCAIALTVSAALAEDFAFSVPVEVSNLHPDLKQGFVECAVRDKAGVLLGVSKTPFVVTNGSYKGIVPVKFNTTFQSNNVNASQWDCTLGFPAGMPYNACNVMKTGGPYPRDTNMPCVDILKGSIAQPATGGAPIKYRKLK